MKAQNLTISIPNTGCDRDCPYCVSKMTGYIKKDANRMLRNLPKVLKLANAAQVTSVLFTGKGEPCQNLDTLVCWMGPFKDFHMELQTNGTRLDDYSLRDLYEVGLDVLAFSFDRLSHFEQFSTVVAYARKLGMVVRATLNITDNLPDDLTFQTILDLTKKHGYRQLSLRKITVPNRVKLRGQKALNAKKWISEHVRKGQYETLVEQIPVWNVVRRLSFGTVLVGAIVYDVDGVAVTYFDYCIQDEHGPDDIRSLIFMEDGHLYTAWNSKASILF